MSSKEQYTRLQEARLRYSASSDSIQRPTSNSNGSDYAPVLPQQQQFQHIAQSPSNPPPPMPQKNIYNDASIFAPPLSNYNSNSSHSNPQSNYGTPRTNSVEPLTDFSTRPIFSSSAAANALGFKPNHIRDVSDTHSRNSSMDKFPPPQIPMNIIGNSIARNSLSGSASQSSLVGRRQTSQHDINHFGQLSGSNSEMERMNHDAGTLGKNSNLYEFPMSNFARPVSKTFSSPVTPSPYIQSPDTPQTPKSPFNGTNSPVKLSGRIGASPSLLYAGQPQLPQSSISVTSSSSSSNAGTQSPMYFTPISQHQSFSSSYQNSTMPKSRSSRQGLNLSTETLSTPQTISSHNDLTTSPASETFSYSSSANSPVSPLSSPHSPTNTNNKQVGGRLRSIDNSSLGTKQASESSESVSDLLPTAVMSNWAKARSIFFWIVVAPSIGMPILLNNIQLQNPNGLYGYAENWAWAGIFMPLTTFMVAIFPTFIVSTIMGSIKSTAQLIAWRISSVTLASGAAITAYAVVAEVIYPSLTKTHITFPVPWTPIWIPPLATAVASFTARLIRLQSDWRLPPNLHATTNSNQQRRGPSPSVLQYASNKIRTIIRHTCTLYILSMMYCSLTLMIFTHLKNNNNNGHSSTSNPGVAEVKKENLQEFFSYTAFLFVSLIIGKRTSNYIMKRILASGGFYKLKVSASSTESKSSPNSAVVIASSEYWWNLTECLLITTFLEDPLEIYFLHGLFIVECALHYWDIRGQRMQYKHQLSPVNYSPEATKSSPVTSSNTEPPSNNSANGTRSNIPTTRSNYELSSEWRGSGKQPARSTSSDDLYNSNDDLTARKRRMGSINLKQIPSFSSLTDLNSPGTSSYSSPGVVAAQGSISNLYPGEMPATPTRRKMMAAELLNLGSPLAESLLTSYTFAVVRLFGLAQISLFHFTVSSLNSRYIRTISIPQLSLMTVLNIMFILVVSRLAAARNVKITTNFINMTYLAMGSWISLMIASMGWLTLWFVTHGGSLV